MKICITCKEEKELDDFGTLSVRKSGKNNSCLECERIRATKENAKPATKLRLRVQNWKRSGLDITIEQYNYMMMQQGACCGSCGTLEEVLCVDHCHTTGKIRGLLCDDCNVGVARLGDTLQGVQGAVAYLQV